MIDKYKICVVGLGYVGLPLAHAFAKKGFEAYGLDIDVKRIKELYECVDRTNELSPEELQEVVDKMHYISDIQDARGANIYIVTVPTPIDDSNKPDLTPLIKASQSVAKVLKEDDIVIYESTVYPGVTEEVCVPVLEKLSGLKYNKDFYCGYSPERINPGDKVHTITKIKKVTSGSNSKIANIVDDLYATIIDAGTFKCTSIKVAEASKVIENTQRDVNIALINELALIFDIMKINTNEVIEAAGTKWNFIKLKPGLVGGHCIGVDPYYLTYKAQELGYAPNLILGARQINNGMSKYIAEKTVKILIQNDKKIKGANILVMGFTFKENCPDTRNTKVVDLVRELQEYTINISVYEPWMSITDTKQYSSFNFISNPFETDSKYDAIIIAVGHELFKQIPVKKYDEFMNGNSIIIDIKGILPSATWTL